MMFVPDGDICKEIFHAVNACVHHCYQMQHSCCICVCKRRAVHKFCVTDHEVNFNFVNWYLHGVHVLEIVSKFFLFSDGWFHLYEHMVSHRGGTGVNKIVC
jgi:hypothetical protein